MSDVDTMTELHAAEQRLQQAQLSSDAEALDTLLHEDLIFTGPDGAVMTKDDDLLAHRHGSQRLEVLESLDLRAVVVGTTGVTWVLVRLAGWIGPQPFEGVVRYTRTWVLQSTVGWRILAAQATFVTTATAS